jgi:hypothetical protein
LADLNLSEGNAMIIKQAMEVKATQAFNMFDTATSKRKTSVKIGDIF